MAAADDDDDDKSSHSKSPQRPKTPSSPREIPSPLEIPASPRPSTAAMDAFGDYDSVATARALRVMLAFEDSGASLSDVVPDDDAGCDREALARALDGHESLRELGDKELSALLGEAGRFVDDERRVTRASLGAWLTNERERLREELAARLHLAEAPAAAPGPAPSLVPEGEAPPPSPSAVSSASAFSDLLFGGLRSRDPAVARAAAEVAARDRARERARAIAFKHRQAARESRIFQRPVAATIFESFGAGKQ